MTWLRGQFVHQGEKFPRGYGLGYRECCTFGGMFYPIPINLLVRWGRNVWFWASGCINPSWMDARFQRYYDMGVEAGRNECASRVQQLEDKMDTLIARRRVEL